MQRQLQMQSKKERFFLLRLNTSLEQILFATRATTYKHLKLLIISTTIKKSILKYIQYCKKKNQALLNYLDIISKTNIYIFIF